MGKKVLNVTLFDTTRGKLPYSNVTIKRKKNYQPQILFSYSTESLFFLAIIYILYKISFSHIRLWFKDREKTYEVLPWKAMHRFERFYEDIIMTIFSDFLLKISI